MRYADRPCPACRGTGIVALAESNMTFEGYTRYMTSDERATVTDDSPVTCGVCGGDGDLAWLTDKEYAWRVRFNAA